MTALYFWLVVLQLFAVWLALVLPSSPASDVWAAVNAFLAGHNTSMLLHHAHIWRIRL